jgi:hypothetical protein
MIVYDLSFGRWPDYDVNEGPGFFLRLHCPIHGYTKMFMLYMLRNSSDYTHILDIGYTLVYIFVAVLIYAKIPAYISDTMRKHMEHILGELNVYSQSDTLC